LENIAEILRQNEPQEYILLDDTIDVGLNVLNILIISLHEEIVLHKEILHLLIELLNGGVILCYEVS
jgi:hypothetical protein